jgi:aldose 1-epimerase
MHKSLALLAGLGMASLLWMQGSLAGVEGSQGSLEKRPFGKTPDGTPIELYVLKNGKATVKVMTYGAIVTELHVPDRQGKTEDVVLGFDTLESYLGGHPYFGATVGRVANRIAKGTFTLDGRDYRLAVNNGPNALHGGLKGFDKVIWKGEDVSGPDGPAVRFTYLSKNGEEGYPGNLSVAVTYALLSSSDSDALRLEYAASTDQATPVNLSNHSYFNLAGPAAGTILRHGLELAADQYTPTDDTLIPTGAIVPVRGTPFDFRTLTPIGARFDQLKSSPVGYDHNFVLRGASATTSAPRPAARVHEPRTGRVLEVLTTEPGVQFYTGNFLDGTLTGKGGVVYRQHQAFCLETQHFPDSVHHANFPSTILRPGSTYTQATIYKFSAR